MTFLRILIFGLLAYWVFRLLRGLNRREKPRVRKGKSRQKPDPFAGADIEEVSFTELPPEEIKGERSQEPTPPDQTQSDK